MSYLTIAQLGRLSAVEKAANEDLVSGGASGLSATSELHPSGLASLGLIESGRNLASAGEGLPRDLAIAGGAGGAALGGGLGALGGGLWGAISPGEDEEGEERSRLREALKRALMLGIPGAVVGGAGGGAAGLAAGGLGQLALTGTGLGAAAMGSALAPAELISELYDATHPDGADATGEPQTEAPNQN
jgi:hypothetical protein